MRDVPFRTTTKTAPTGEDVTVSWYYDPHMGPPWKEHDGHGIVSEWRRGRDKAPGERILSESRGSYQFFDFTGSIERAKTQNWGLGEDSYNALAQRLGRKPTAREELVESVELDFKLLKRWCDNDWYWCGYIVSVNAEERDTPDPMSSSLWGIDSDSIQHFEDEAFEVVFSDLQDEQRNSFDAACRDIETVGA